MKDPGNEVVKTLLLALIFMTRINCNLHLSSNDKNSDFHHSNDTEDI